MKKSRGGPTVEISPEWQTRARAALKVHTGADDDYSWLAAQLRLRRPVRPAASLAAARREKGNPSINSVRRMLGDLRGAEEQQAASSWVLLSSDILEIEAPRHVKTEDDAGGPPIDEEWASLRVADPRKYRELLKLARSRINQIVMERMATWNPDEKSNDSDVRDDDD